MPYSDKEKRKEYNREYNREYMKRDRAANLEKYLARETKWRTDNPAQRLIYCTRQTAKKRGLEHNITADDLVLPTLCPYTGNPIDYSAGTGKTMEKPSVDRIDPNKGYIKGNVEVMSSLANSMKNRANPRELVAFAKEVLRRYDNV